MKFTHFQFSGRGLLSSVICLLSSVIFPGTASAQTTTLPHNTTYTSGQNVTVNGPTHINNDNGAGGGNTVTVNSDAIVKFRATTSITLKPGFTAAAGSTFRAFIFVDTDGDGMDDAWEAAHGLSDPAADADLDGLSNLAEYLLGTNPTIDATPDSSSSPATQLKIHRLNQ